MEIVHLEETLGSVTQMDINSPTSGVPLRSSARVSKMKLDSLNKSIITSPTSEKRDHKKEDVPEEAEKAPARCWPMHDKELFFEAINEYGKDFPAIQRYFELKNKKGNSGKIKTIKQIRYFYYRTWAKISPKLVFPPHIKKQTQELYGLINYGELRKKMKVRVKKDALRLNELVIRGFTQLRGKNKNIHVRTPRCRTLRRLCQLEENQETETRLPTSIRMELVPSDNLTWARVQATAQNPRIYIHVPLQYRISSLLQYLQRRWLPRHEKYKTKVMEVFDGESTQTDFSETLVLRPKSTADVHLYQVNLSNYNSHTKLCLSAYEEKLGKKGASLEILKRLYAEHGAKLKKQKLESAAEKEAKKSEGEKEALLAKEVKQIENEAKDDKIDSVSLEVAGKTEPNDLQETKKEVVTADDTTVTSSQPIKEENQNEDEIKKETMETSTEEADSANDEVLTKLRAGWTLENCGTITAGDIYLMVGCDHKVQLDYFWRPNEEKISVSVLSNMLSGLVRFARLTRTQCPVKCPCGHQCSDAKRPRKDSFGDESAAGDAGFRRPPAQAWNKRIAQTTTGRLDAESFRAQMDKLTPRYCNRRGRGITPKTVVVQRTLPLLPKTNNGHPVVTLKQFIQQSSQLPGEFFVQSTPAVSTEPRRIAPKVPDPPDPPPSPTPSLSTLFGDTLKDFPPPVNFSGETIEEGPPPSPSPSVILREGWLNEDETDYSLSSILSHLDTTLKQTNPPSLESAAPDVESQLQYLMSETSIDYMAKFADLAAKVTSEGSQ